ncbi:MAG: hypothetical protein WBL80_06290 [Erysipelotrichaceae bacterium]
MNIRMLQIVVETMFKQDINRENETVRTCPFCKDPFTGRPKQCPKCNARLIKRGTSDQFIDEVKQ